MQPKGSLIVTATGSLDFYPSAGRRYGGYTKPPLRLRTQCHVSNQSPPGVLRRLFGNHTRFTHPLDEGTGHLGDFITDAPVATGSLALYLEDLRLWSGGLDVRYLGNYRLSSGPCVNSAVHDFRGVATSCANAPTAPGQVNGRGFAQVNLDAHYTFPAGWCAVVGVYNLFNTHAAAAEFCMSIGRETRSAATPTDAPMSMSIRSNRSWRA